MTKIEGLYVYMHECKDQPLHLLADFGFEKSSSRDRDRLRTHGHSFDRIQKRASDMTY